MQVRDVERFTTATGYCAKYPVSSETNIRHRMIVLYLFVTAAADLQAGNVETVVLSSD